MKQRCIRNSGTVEAGVERWQNKLVSANRVVTQRSLLGSSGTTRSKSVRVSRSEKRCCIEVALSQLSAAQPRVIEQAVVGEVDLTQLVTHITISDLFRTSPAQLVTLLATFFLRPRCAGYTVSLAARSLLIFVSANAVNDVSVQSSVTCQCAPVTTHSNTATIRHLCVYVL